MKLYRKIDPTTGDFIEDCLLESQPMLTEILTTEIEVEGVLETIEQEAVVLDADGNPVADPQYVEDDVPQGFYWPKWNGTEWVEGGVAPDPVPPVPTEVERIAAIEETIDFLLMGGM